MTAVVVAVLVGLGAVGPARGAPSARGVGSRPVASAGLPQIGNLVPPALLEAPRYGRRVAAGPGTWTDPWRTGDLPAFGYRWYRDGERIAGATSPRYQPSRADVGRDLAVEVTASRPGCRPLPVTSAAVKVGRAVVAILESTENRRKREDGVRKGGSITLTFLLGSEADGGRATAVLAGEVVGRAEVAGGRLVIRMHTDRPPDLERGTRPFEIRYAGTARAESAARSLWLLIR